MKTTKNKVVYNSLLLNNRCCYQISIKKHYPKLKHFISKAKRQKRKTKICTYESFYLQSGLVRLETDLKNSTTYLFISA